MGEKMVAVKKICNNCNFCEKNDGKPYCYLKDLYTTVMNVIAVED